MSGSRQSITAADGLSWMNARLAFVFAHYDDSVLSAYLAMRTATSALDVVVCGGVPELDRPGPWDIRSGFSSASQALCSRAVEHERARGEIPGHHIELEQVDAQYGESNPAQEMNVVEDLTAELHEFSPDVVVTQASEAVHSDHRLTSRFAIEAAGCLGIPVVFVCDRPYKDCAHVCELARSLDLEGEISTSVPLDDSPWEAKVRAITAYRSQQKPLEDAFGPTWGQRPSLGLECYHFATSPFRRVA
jgi:LmbE family N-acetylglucosaminyl deacetylase